MSKLDRGYENLVSSRISDQFWTRKSQEWEAELAMVDPERPRLAQQRALATASVAEILGDAVLMDRRDRRCSLVTWRQGIQRASR
jgi:hypothetical protein